MCLKVVFYIIVIVLKWYVDSFMLCTMLILIISFISHCHHGLSKGQKKPNTREFHISNSNNSRCSLPPTWCKFENRLKDNMGNAMKWLPSWSLRPRHVSLFHLQCNFRQVRMPVVFFSFYQWQYSYDLLISKTTCVLLILLLIIYFLRLW